MAIDRRRALATFKDEYFPNWFEAIDPGTTNVLGAFHERAIPDPDLAAQNLTPDEWREALRACKGMTLRQETCELDVDELAAGRERPVKLFSAAAHGCHVRMLQGMGDNAHAVFLVTESESLAYQYELDLRAGNVTPDPRVAHTLNLTTDERGNVLQSAAVVYARASQFDDPSGAIDVTLVRGVQGSVQIAYTEQRFTLDLDRQDDFRLRAPFETLTYELTAFMPSSGGYFSLDDLRGYRLSDAYQTSGTAVTDWQYHQIPTGGPGRRIVDRLRVLYFDDTLSGPLAFGRLGVLGMVYESYKLALTPELLSAVFDTKLADTVPTGGTASTLLGDASRSGYLSGNALATPFPDLAASGQYWIRSGTAGFAAGALQAFALPDRYTDPFSNTTTLVYDAAYRFHVASITDPMGNSASVTAFDFRVLAPSQLQDANDDLTDLYFDAFGLVVATALRGKGADGDDLVGFDANLANPTHATLDALFTGNYDETVARTLLARATTRCVYSLGDALVGGTVAWNVHPASACIITRETHTAALAAGATSRIFSAFQYTDGLSAAIVTKTLAEPDPDVAGSLSRWIASGKTIFNNKGKPVKQYEPYFSAAAHRFEEPAEVGVTPILYYDAPGRLIRTELPDGTLTRVEFSPWDVARWDANDTVLESQWYVDRGSPDPSTALAVTASADTRAAWLAAQHAKTPSLAFLDSLGREVVSVADLGVPDPNGVSKYVTFTKLDIEGKPLWIRDARNNIAMRYTVPATAGADPTTSFVTCYDISGNLLFQHSIDSGDRWLITDAAGQPMLGWDENERQVGTAPLSLEQRVFETEYDALRRPTAHWLGAIGGVTAMVERFEYADTSNNASLAADKQNRLIGRLRRHYDPSGLTEVIRLDFKGNTEEVDRTLTNQYNAAVIDWQTPAGLLESETFAQISELDALSRPTRVYNWHLGTGSRVAVYSPSYSERGLLSAEAIEIGATKTAASYTPPTTALVNAIGELRYDAKGQREYMKLGNGSLTRHEYDPKTFRLVQLTTTRTTAATNPAFPDYHARLNDPAVLQQLSYTYDAVGNVTEIYDDAFAPVFFQNRAIDATNQYEYDALYRLASASGRENGAYAGAPMPSDSATPVTFPIPNNPNAQRRYEENFQYDAVGNMRQIQHVAGVGSWTRALAPKTDSNRLDSTSEGTNPPVMYRYDTHGNMLNIAATGPGQDLVWDHRDMIASLDLVGGGFAYYGYDSSKRRTRKRLVRNTGDIEDSVYLGGFDLYRRYSPTDLTTPVEVMESHHLFEGEQRVLLVDDILTSATYPVETLYRYQYSNHLGSSCLELDDQQQIISYEEYHPYGSSAFRFTNSAIEVPLKRYRYGGMERDDESGLSYHHTRFYAPWLTRWLSCDPSGLGDGINLFRYGSCNPAVYVDPNGQASGKPLAKAAAKVAEFGEQFVYSARTAARYLKGKRISGDDHGVATGLMKRTLKEAEGGAETVVRDADRAAARTTRIPQDMHVEKTAEDMRAMRAADAATGNAPSDARLTSPEHSAESLKAARESTRIERLSINPKADVSDLDKVTDEVINRQVFVDDLNAMHTIGKRQSPPKGLTNKAIIAMLDEAIKNKDVQKVLAISVVITAMKARAAAAEKADGADAAGVTQYPPTYKETLSRQVDAMNAVNNVLFEDSPDDQLSVLVAAPAALSILPDVRAYEQLETAMVSNSGSRLRNPTIVDGPNPAILDLSTGDLFRLRQDGDLEKVAEVQKFGDLWGGDGVVIYRDDRGRFRFF